MSQGMAFGARGKAPYPVDKKAVGRREKASLEGTSPGDRML